MFKNYFKTAWRNLLFQKKMSFINIGGLSIGMASAIMIILWVQNENSYDSYHPGAKNIYRITNYTRVSSGDGNTWIRDVSPYVFGSEIQKKIPEVAMVSRILDATSYSSLAISLNKELVTEKSFAYVDDNWFNMFRYELVKGSLTGFVQDPHSIVLTETKASKFFGGANPIGQVLQIDSIPYTVQAVVKDNPENSSFQYDILLPAEAYLSNPNNSAARVTWGGSAFITFLNIRSDANKTSVEQKITRLYLENTKSYIKNPKNNWSTLVQLHDMHFETDLQSFHFKHIDRKTVTIFSIIAILILFTACINYVNLTTARSSLRAKEVSIRKIVGASKWQLFYQFFADSILISCCSIIAALLLVELGLPFFNTLMETKIAFSLNNFQLWQTILCLLVITTLLNGVYPALLLASFQPLRVFRGIYILKIKDVYFRRSLILFQFSIAVILITGTIVVFQQMQYIQKTNSDYNKSQVVNITIPAKRPARQTWAEMLAFRKQQNSLIENLKTNLLKESSITSIAVGQTDIINSNTKASGGYDWNGRPEDFNPSISSLNIDEDFPKIFQLKLKKGKWFSDHDESTDIGFVLNETAIKELNIHQPAIGQAFKHMDDAGHIIGVVKDFHFQSMHDKIGPLVLFNRPYWRDNMFIVVQSGQSLKALQAISNRWKQLFPFAPFEYHFLDEKFDNLYKTDRKTSYLISLFSLTAIFISGMGLFGLISFTAERKTKEIGIRRVLGASARQIVAVLSKEFIYLVLLSIISATPIAWYCMNKWLENFAYRIQLNIWIFLAAGVLALLIALITVSIQAIKAAMANPVNCLRTE